MYPSVLPNTRRTLAGLLLMACAPLPLWADEVESDPEFERPATLEPVITPPPVAPPAPPAPMPTAETVPTPSGSPSPGATAEQAPEPADVPGDTTATDGLVPSDTGKPEAHAETATPELGDLPVLAAPADPVPFRLLEVDIAPGSLVRVPWYPPDSFSGLSEPTPVLVAHGHRPGPVLCLTAATHGDELNGIEIVRRIVYDVDPQQLSGTLIGVPIVNLQGFRQGSRYVADRRDLNRHFPGHRRGSAASRIAHSLFSEIIVHCNAVVDLHTGSFHRTNLPQVRGDLRIEAVAHLTKGFGATSVLNGAGPTGSLRRAATDIGIPAVTLEAGEPLRFQPEEVDHGVRALRSLLNHLQMVPRFRRWGEPQPVYYESHWVRANEGGILVSQARLGAVVTKNQVLGTVTDPITNRRHEIRSPYDGRVLGMALNQAVIPGFAAYHIGIRRTEAELTTESGEETLTPAPPGDDAGPPEASAPLPSPGGPTISQAEPPAPEAPGPQTPDG